MSDTNMTEVSEFCARHGACSDGAAWAKQYNTLAEVWDHCKRGDWMIWMLTKANKLTKRLAVEIAIECANHVLQHFVNHYPSDTRPGDAIAAAQAWLASDTPETRAAADDAAAAAGAARAACAAGDAGAAEAAEAAGAAGAARAAWAAAEAAGDAGAARATWAAGDAANAAANAAYAAAYAAANAAYAAAYAEQHWQSDMLRRVAGNPFHGGLANASLHGSAVADTVGGVVRNSLSDNETTNRR